MQAKPTTVVSGLAICGNCGKALGWNGQFRLWYHFDTGNQDCPNPNL